MKIAVLGAAQTKFGELWDKSLGDLLAESQLAALADAGIKPIQIDAIFTGNMCAGLFENQLNLGGMASEILNINVESTVVEGACASGGLALRAGIRAIESGQAKIVLVNGVEKMTDISCEGGSGECVASGLMAAASQETEYFHGATFPALNAMLARLYMETYGLTREQLACVSVQNHANGFLNPHAHLRKKITIDHVINAQVIADPLTMLDCSPVSDGAASIVLCSEQIAENFTQNPVFIIGSGQASDTLQLCARDDLLSWKATQLAAKQAYGQAGVGPRNIDLAEIHDGFSIVQILALEDLGFFEKGTAGKAIEAGEISLNSKLSINPSGGLKSKGHPVGATGVGQAVEIVQQLRSNCG
ncbi:thiolase domain-containing protein, partial [Candidatus Babeliales bacterium]|nr:thiolase domain-containing protein [Candidatus Babeliales bacterium]